MSNNPFVANSTERKNPFVDYEALAVPQENIQQGLPPAEAAPVPDVEGGIYANSPQFKDLISRGVADLESLSSEEKGQFEIALKHYPSLKDYAQQTQQLQQQPEANQDLQPIAESFGRLGEAITLPSYGRIPNPAIGKALLETGAAMVDLSKKAFGEFFGNVIGYEQRTGEKISETVSKSFDELGLKPLEKDDPRAHFTFYRSDGDNIEVPMTESARVATNLVINAIRFVPEIGTAALEDPGGFQAAVVQFPFQEANIILEAATGASVSFDDEGKITAKHVSDKEVDDAIESIKQNPLGVLLLGLMAKGVASRFTGKGGKITVEKSTVEKLTEEVKKAEEAKVVEKAEKLKPEVPAEDLGEIKRIQETPDAKLRTELLDMQKGAKEPIKAFDIAKMTRNELENRISAGKIPIEKVKKEVTPEPAKIEAKKPEVKPKEPVKEPELELDAITPEELTKAEKDVTTLETDIANKLRIIEELEQSMEDAGIKTGTKAAIDMDIFKASLEGQLAEAKVKSKMATSRLEEAQKRPVIEPKPAKAPVEEKPKAEEAPIEAKIPEKPKAEPKIEEKPPKEAPPFTEEELADVDLSRNTGPQRNLRESQAIADWKKEIKKQEEALKAENITEPDKVIAQKVIDKANTEITKLEASIAERNKPVTTAEELGIRIEKRENINLDPERFQNREAEFSEESVKRIVDDFDATKFDPVIVWKDPKTGKQYLLSGHSRLEAMKRLGKEDVPVKEFEGTESEAVQFARVEANRLATRETLKEDIAAFKLAKKQKTSKEKLRDAFGEKNIGDLEAMSHLDPSGKFILTKTQKGLSEHPHISRWTRNVGDLRKAFPELTNRHEQQIFDQLYPADKGKGLFDKLTKDDLFTLVDRQINDITWKKDNPIKIRKDKEIRTGTPDQREVRNLIDKQKSIIADLNKQLKDKDFPLTKEEASPKILKALAEIERMEAGLKTIQKTQGSMFDMLESTMEKIEPLEDLGAGFNPLKPFRSLRQQLSSRMRIADRQIESAKRPDVFVERKPADVGVSRYLKSPQSIFDAVPDITGTDIVTHKGVSIPLRKGKYGNLAQEAQAKLLLHEFDMLVEKGNRGEFLDNALSNVNKKDWGKKGEVLYDHIVDPAKDSKLAPESLEAVQKIRKFMETDRQEVIQRRRDELRPHVSKITEREWRAENGLKGKKLTPELREKLNEAIENSIKNRIPEDWGVANYLPQMHPGNWTVYADVKGVTNHVGTAGTPSKAIDVAMKHRADNPNVPPDAYYVTGRAYKGSDVVRVSTGKFKSIVNEIAKDAENILSKDNIKSALAGQVGTKAGKKKFAGFLQKREGFEGYRKDIKGVLAVYNENYVRWKHLSDMNKEIQPLIETIRKDRPNAAQELQNTLDHVWGKVQTDLSSGIDATLQNVPGLKDVIGPRFYDRALGRIKGGVVNLFLKSNPRFQLLNSFQPLQTTAPNIPGGYYGPAWRTGIKFWGSKEGKAALEGYGVGHLTGGKFLEGGRTYTKAKTRERLGRLAPETSNQEIAWSIMFQEAKKSGMSDAAANYYAFLKGNVYTQFAHLATDTPKILRGPTTSTIFQFKRFPIKNIEMGIDLIKHKKYPGFARWVGAQLILGGAKVFTKPIVALGGATAAYFSLETYNKIKDEHGEEVANTLYYGLPGLAGLDMSGSFGLIDTPYGNSLQEQIGNLFLGPAGQTSLAITTAALDTKGTETSASYRALIQAANRIPALKPLVAMDAIVEKINTGEYNFKSSDGQIKFKGDLKDVIIKGLGGRTTEEANVQLLIESISAVTEEYDRTLDIQAAQIIEAIEKGEDIDITPVNEWNELWGEFPITTDALDSRLKARFKKKDLTRWERFRSTLPKIFKAAGGNK